MHTPGEQEGEPEVSKYLDDQDDECRVVDGKEDLINEDADKKSA
jgi:hypothetical protein